MKKIILSLFLTFVVTISSIAQDVPVYNNAKKPTLNGHQLISLTAFSSPFTNTRLKSSFGIGSTGKISIPGITIGNTELFSFEGSLLFVDGGINYQQQVNRNFAIFFTGIMSGRLGTHMSTILADGVNTLMGGSAGIKVKVAQTQKWIVTGVFFVQNLNGRVINVSEYVNEIISGDPNPAIVKNVPITSINLGATAYHAFNETFGIHTEVGVGYGESFSREAEDSYYIFGVSGDMDLNPNSNVPIGFALGFLNTTYPQIVFGEGKSSNIYSGKIEYTGANDFDLGLQFSVNNLEIKTVGSEPYIKKVTLFLGFYF